VINFRYHVVSLVAVFLALAVGVVLGASILGQGINDQIITQASNDRKALEDLRALQGQQQNLDRYRDAYDQQMGAKLAANLLAGERVAIVVMPDTPRSVVSPIIKQVATAGGVVTTTVTVAAKAFDPDQQAPLAKALDGLPGLPGADVAPPDRFGAALSRALVSTSPEPSDDGAKQILTRLRQEGFVTAASTEVPRTTLLIVVSAPVDPDRPVPSAQIQDHLSFDLALARQTVGTVVAGANSTGITNSDVAAVRASSSAAQAMSTVDVADLPSGVTTVMLSLVEEIRGAKGHYGAAPSSDAPAPKLIS